MSTASDSYDLTRVGPETVMGRFLRQYWIPAALSSELAPDGDPMRLMLLSEKLIAFRDSAGRVGIFDHNCPHRCASLFLARNEENGIRCVYHGWKFDVEGRCLEMPNVPAHQDFRAKVRAKAYKVEERAGLIWVYMGEREKAPPMPMIEALFVPQADLKISLLQRESNWLQGLEGDIDTSHFGFLHAGGIKAEDFAEGHPARHTVSNRAPEYNVTDTEWGTMYGAYRMDPNGLMHWRMAHFAFPFWTQTPNADFADRVVAKAWVPMDDTHTMLVSIFGGAAKGSTYSSMALKDGGPTIPGSEPFAYLPNTTDWHGRWRAAQNERNDWQMDREAQRKGGVYSGIRSIVMQDQAVTESMGPIVDHAKEHLAPSDLMIARTRRRLLATARDFAETGIAPGVDNAEIYWKARSGSFYADPQADWLAAYDEQLRKAIRWPAGDRQAAE